jgi:hypothetical protein
MAAAAASRGTSVGDDDRPRYESREATGRRQWCPTATRVVASDVGEWWFEARAAMVETAQGTIDHSRRELRQQPLEA